MMLVFIVPLQSPQASTDWRRVSSLAQRTIGSLLAQQHPAFHVVLVCNEPPIGCPSDSRLQILQRSFPAPEVSIWENRMSDKWRKVRVGLVGMRDVAPCHLMVVDADDCVSNRLAGFSAASPDSVGWVFERGWMHDEGSSLIYLRRREFDAICGTSSIVHVNRDELPVNEEGGREDNFVLKSGHTKIRTYMMDRGTPLQRLPFVGAVYNLGTGENHTSFSLKAWRSKRVMLQKALSYRLLTSRIREEFTLFTIFKLMRVVLRKIKSFARTLRSPSKLPPLIRRNWVQLIAALKRNKPIAYSLIRDVPFVCFPDQEISLRLYLQGYLIEAIEMEAAYRWIQPGDSCVDVGAHVGVYASLLAHRTGSSGCVLAFEPSPRTFMQLQRCIDWLRLDQVVLLASCATDHSGLVSFHVVSAAGAGPEEESMVVPPDRAGEFKRCLVPCTTVETALAALPPLRPVSFLKIDVEGAEPLVLRGCQSLLKEDQLPLVLAEVHLPALSAYGFKPDDVMEFIPERLFERYLIPMSTSDARPDRQPATIYSLRSGVEWPILANVLAVPRVGRFAEREALLRSLLPSASGTA